MSNPLNVLMSLLHRLGVAGSARVCVCSGSGASKTGRGSGAPITRIATPLVASLALLALTTTPAQAETCPNEAFRTGPSAHLPDCRAYEQVTPPFKASASVLLHQSGAGGSSALLEIYSAVGGLEGFPDAGIAGPTGYYSTQRTASGWTLQPDDPPSSEYLTSATGANPDLAGSSEDGLTTVFIERGVSKPENSFDLYMRRPDHSIADIGPALPPSAPAEVPRVLASNAELNDTGTRGYVSADGSHVFFDLARFFWPGDHTGEVPSGKEGRKSLYEYVGTGNTTPLLVGVSDGTTVVGGRTVPAGEQLGQCGDHLAGTLNAHAAGSMSASGDVVVVMVDPTHECEQAQVSGSGPPVEELFARVDNGLADARTLAISEPSETDCAACYKNKALIGSEQAPTYLGVSEDGSKVFFMTEQELLPGATGENIYEYDFDAPAGEKLVRVSGGDATVSNPVAGVEFRSGFVSLPVVSEDGSHVYFVANGVLTRTPNGEGQSAEAGAHNLYVFDTETGSTAFIAQTALKTSATISSNAEADVTPDGRFIVFTSVSDLTPGDTSTAAQVFEYDAQTGVLSRISVGQEGFNHNGNVAPTLFSEGREVNAVHIPVAPDGYSSEHWSQSAVSADGAYVFFESIAGLTPQAFNEEVGGYLSIGGSLVPYYANNVYEYHGGRVSLISDGRDLSQSVELTGTDASGADVFFTTRDPLVGQDTDTDFDVYDARVDGGFPAPVAPSSCAGEECQGALSGAPTLLSPGSEFQAGGNPPLTEPAPVAVRPKPKAKSAKCKRGFVKKKGKCVRAKTKKAGAKRGAKS